MNEKLTDGIYVRYDSEEHTKSEGYSRIEYSWTGHVSIYDEMFDENLVRRNCSCGQSCYDRSFAIKDGYIQFLGNRIDIPDEVMALRKGDRSAFVARLEKGFNYLKAGKTVDINLLQKLFEKVNKFVESDVERLKAGSGDRDELAQRLKKIRAIYQSKEVQEIIDEKTRLKLQKMETDELLNEDMVEKKKERNERRQEVIAEKKKMAGLQKRLTAYSTRKKKEENADRKDLLKRLKKLQERFDSSEMKEAIPEESKRLKLRGVMHRKLKKEAGE